MDITQSEAAKKIALSLFQKVSQQGTQKLWLRLFMLFPKITEREQEAVIEQIDEMLQRWPDGSGRSMGFCGEKNDTEEKYDVKEIVNQRWFRLIHSLSLSPFEQTGEVVGYSDYVAHITTITVQDKIVRSEFIDGLLGKRSKLSSLRNLSFIDCSVSPEVMTRLRTAARSGQIENLEFIRQRNDPVHFSAQHVGALLDGPGLDGLRTLRLMHYFLGSDSFELMARSEGLMKIEQLLLSKNEHDKNRPGWTEGIQALLGSSSVLENLRVLDLKGCPIKDESLIAIAKSPRTNQLDDLNLGGLLPGEDAMFILATSPMLTTEMKRKLVKAKVIPHWMAVPIGIVDEDDQNHCQR